MRIKTKQLLAAFFLGTLLSATSLSLYASGLEGPGNYSKKGGIPCDNRGKKICQ